MQITAVPSSAEGAGLAGGPLVVLVVLVPPVDGVHARAPGEKMNEDAGSVSEPEVVEVVSGSSSSEGTVEVGRDMDGSGSGGSKVVGADVVGGR